MRPLTVALLMSAVSATSAVAQDGDRSPIFDFTDQFYRANGVDPALLAGRMTGVPPVSIVDQSNDATRRDVRALLTIPAYDDSGDLVFFTVVSVITSADGFTDDDAGREARDIADEFPIFLFPSANADPNGGLSKRQQDVVELRHGYFSNNPLGLWRNVTVHFTDAAFNTADGRDALADLAARNGVDLDGTPIIKRVNDIDDLADDGYVSLTFPNPDGSEGAPWTVCPVYEDPRGGAMAPDAFLAIDPNPADAERFMIDEFGCLQQTGDWCDGTGSCSADFTGDGRADTNDFFAFLAAFQGADSSADMTSNGTIDTNDFFAYLSAYQSGC